MNAMIPKDKMSKKAQREMNRKRRAQWDVKPVTKVIPNKKREKLMKARYGGETAGRGFFIALF